MSDEMRGWEEAYREGHTRGREPHEEVESLAVLFREDGVKRVLDLGCGDGRHLVRLGALGFQMYGLDSAPTAVRLAGGFLEKDGLSAELVCSDMSELPWDDGFFDAVILIQVLNHQDIDGIHTTFGEVHRVLRPNGWLFMTVATYDPDEPGDGDKLVQLGPKLYAKKEGHEAGVPHYFATEEEWVAELSAFQIVDVHKDGPGKTAILARKAS